MLPEASLKYALPNFSLHPVFLTLMLPQNGRWNSAAYLIVLLPYKRTSFRFLSPKLIIVLNFPLCVNVTPSNQSKTFELCGLSSNSLPHLALRYSVYPTRWDLFPPSGVRSWSSLPANSDVSLRPLSFLLRTGRLVLPRNTLKPSWSFLCVYFVPCFRSTRKPGLVSQSKFS